MAKLRAAVLAAGRGVRMGGREPKTLLPLDGERPILHHILSGLAVSGIRDVLVVTGFMPHRIQEFVVSSGIDLDVSYVRNARFASWGNFHSVRVALDQSPGYDVLVVNSDVVVHPDVYTRVARTRGDLVLAVQQRLVLDDEDMRVRLEGDRVLAVSKTLPRGHSHGEYAGVSLLRSQAARLYLDESSRREWLADTDGYYEDVYNTIAPAVDARAAVVGDDEYAEVDTPDDVAGARAVIERHAAAWSPAAA